MKKHLEVLIFFSILVFLLSCNSPKERNIVKNHSGYTIQGSLSKKSESKTIYLYNVNNSKIDSAKISKNNFLLKGRIFSPDYYYLKLEKGKTKYPVVLENTNYKALINGDDFMIIGGKLNTKLSSYQFIKRKYALQKSNEFEKFSKRNLTLREYLKRVDSLRKLESTLFTSFMKENSNNIISAILLDDTSMSSKNAIRLRSKIIKTTNNKALLNKIDTLINNLKIAEAEGKILRRKPVPLFSGVNLAGRQTHLEDIIKDKKAFLIDFWASWCPPCREASPKLKELYHIYKRKGFDILTVSEDRSVTDWKNGIYIDGIQDWHHVYDDFNRISSMFGVGALPHMVLVDENGKIIKNNISMDSLEEQLEKIFGKEL